MADLAATLRANAQRTAAIVAHARRTGQATRRTRMPAYQWPARIEEDYARAIAAAADVRDDLEPLMRALPELLRGAAQALGRADEGESARARQLLQRARARLEASLGDHTLEPTTRRYAHRTLAHHQGQLQRQMRAKLGVDLQTADPGAAALVEAFVSENVALIRSLGTRTLDEVAALVTRAFGDGARAESVVDEIQARYGIAERHARLIARDQVGKLNGRIAAARHQELGIASFKWRSMKDQRVRPRHVHLDGQVFRYPEGAPGEGIPGHPIQCRCFQEPVVDDILAELEAIEAGEGGGGAPPPGAGAPGQVAAAAGAAGGAPPAGAGGPPGGGGGSDSPPGPSGRRRQNPKGAPAEAVARHVAAGEFGQAREVLQDHLERGGVALNDEARGARVVEVKQDGILGQHLKDGTIELDPSTAERARDFGDAWTRDRAKVREKLERATAQRTRRGRNMDATPIERDGMGMKTFVHEVLHGCGPMRHGEYVGRSGTIEEVVTEMAARATMRDMYGWDIRTGTYKQRVNDVVDALRRVPGLPVDRSDVTGMLAEASLSLKGDPRPEPGVMGLTMTDRLARHIAAARPSSDGNANVVGVSFPDGQPATPHELAIASAIRRAVPGLDR
jgi:SPP1 gp7 family putative phage head morphogenesis protein